MTDFDTQLRTLAHALTADAPAPPDLDELPLSVDARRAARTLRRGPLIAAAVAALLALLVVGVAMARGDFDTGQSAPTPADQNSEVQEPASEPTYREPTLTEQLARCDTVTGTLHAKDTATQQEIDLDQREVCRTEARTSPDPSGDMVAQWHAENGQLVVQYHELIRTVTTDAQGNRGELAEGGPRVPDDVAAQKVREYHERLDREAAAHPSARPTFRSP